MQLRAHALVPLALPLVLLGACASNGAAPASGPTDNGPRVDMVGTLDEDAFAALHERNADAAPPLGGETTPIQVAGLPEERATMNGYLALPAEGEGPFPGVVVIHEWWGLTDHVKHWADRLAAEGFAAYAVDLYEGTVATTRDEALSAMRSVDDGDATLRLLAARAYLEREHGGGTMPTGSIGWCFGGGWSLALAMADPNLDACVMYYGRVEYTTADLDAIRARVLGVFAEQDQGIDHDYADPLEEALRIEGRLEEFLWFDAEHAFANPSGGRYDAEAAEAAWRRVREFLAETLKG